MIRSFQHKGLEAFFHRGSKAGIRPDHAQRLQLQLGALDQATGPQDMVPGLEAALAQGACTQGALGHYREWQLALNVPFCGRRR
jgi:proteic killer suppression protein